MSKGTLNISLTKPMAERRSSFGNIWAVYCTRDSQFILEKFSKNSHVLFYVVDLIFLIFSPITASIQVYVTAHDLQDNTRVHSHI